MPALLVLGAVLGGCSETNLSRCIDKLHEAPSQKDIDELDNAGLKGAIAIIGILELEADWNLVVAESGEKYIVTYALKDMGSPVMEGNLEVPREGHFARLFIHNKYVIAWAGEKRKENIEYMPSKSNWKSTRQNNEGRSSRDEH